MSVQCACFAPPGKPVLGRCASEQQRSQTADLCVHLCCRTYILPQDLVGFLPAEKVDHAFEMLDVDGDGKVSLQDIRDAVIQIYKVSPGQPGQGLVPGRARFLGPFPRTL